MPIYDLQLKRTAHASQSVGNITAPGSGMRRGWIWDLNFGCEGDAADNEFLWRFQRCTSAGTRTAVTPIARDPADAACAMTAGENHSAEPTYTANNENKEFPINQRVTYRWQVDEKCGLVIPATANNGIGVLTPVMTALAITCDVSFTE
jgi:hypothetical protein